MKTINPFGTGQTSQKAIDKIRNTMSSAKKVGEAITTVQNATNGTNGLEKAGNMINAVSAIMSLMG